MLSMDREGPEAPFPLFEVFRRNVVSILLNLAARQLRTLCALFQTRISNPKV